MTRKILLSAALLSAFAMLAPAAVSAARPSGVALFGTTSTYTWTTTTTGGNHLGGNGVNYGRPRF